MAGQPDTSQPSYPPQIDDGEKSRLVAVIKDWALGHGLAVRPPVTVVPNGGDPEGVLGTNAPVTLFPSLFPSVCFKQAESVQSVYNELYSKISQDETFLGGLVEEVAKGDDFIAQLWKVHEQVRTEGYVQPLSLGLFRSDYMVHQDTANAESTPQIKQVEFNTIASSFGGLSSLTTSLHEFLARTEYGLLKSETKLSDWNLPKNQSTAGLACGLAVAFNAYGSSKLGLDRCIIFLVQGDERNVFDQRHLEYELASKSPRIPVFRVPFDEVLARTSVASSDGRQLLYALPWNEEKKYEVAVVYMRAGYGPGDYPDQRAWDARLHLERSAAIKCPTVLTQLAGMKKVQQVLATPVSDSPPALSRFIPADSAAFVQLWETFTNIYPMDNTEAGLAAQKLATDPEKCKAYVLKPQREGGGNNKYKTAIPKFLRGIPEGHWKSYILMELITPPPLSNIILRNGKLEQSGVICELGIYGTCLWNHDTKEILHNEKAGYLLRTKGDQSEEGGVAAGFGCMDSCNLV